MKYHNLKNKILKVPYFKKQNSGKPQEKNLYITDGKDEPNKDSLVSYLCLGCLRDLNY